MELSTVLTIVQIIIQLLSCATAIHKEILSALRSTPELEKLKQTMSIIEAVLRDADDQERQHMQLSNVVKNMLKMLKEAVYEADDLFDEVATLAHRKKFIPGNKVSKEVRRFFSRFNQDRSALTMPREIAKIRLTLDGIMSDSGLTKPFPKISQASKISRETHSYLSNKDDIIGRGEDKRIVINMLLNATLDENVPVVAIVGIGGLGKTALAQLIYNDEMIEKEFPLRMWICISDDFDIKKILQKILKCAPNERSEDEPVLEHLQKSLKEKLDGQKYLLILDDIWNEDSNEWHRLINLLVQGVRGSRIVVTTRSRSVARIIPNGQVHNLQGLKELDSFNLFYKMAFEKGQQGKASLLHTGKEIVRNCPNVPLAIRVVGSLLRGQDESRWECLRDHGLAKVDINSQRTLIDVLKPSYFELPFYLKCCFSYCAMFPKDYEIVKEDLICLWMAQGFIQPSSDDDQHFELLGDEYFNTLLDRCFFQDVVRDDNGKIMSCKMRDLIHDVAVEVAGVEIETLSSKCSKGNCNGDTHHLFVHYTADEKIDIKNFFTTMTRMRTLFLHKTFDSESFHAMSKVRRYLRGSDSHEAGLSMKNFHVQLSKAKFLRALDLQGTRLNMLPDMIDELLHLRYLNLSGNHFEKLPKSITKLYNLQTLKLRKCICLKKLPRELSNLVKLRHLDIYDCTGLKRMPPGLNKMTSLQKLTAFVVGGKKKKRLGGILKSLDVGKLGDLKHLNNRSEFMEIVIKKGVDYKQVEAREGEYLLNNQHLKEITIFWWVGGDKNGNDNKNAEAMLQALKPHFNLKKLDFENYPGYSFCAWSGSTMNLKTCLPNLVKIRLYRCERLKHLPFMSDLCHLQILQLDELKELEYVERNHSAGSRRSVPEDFSVYFPSLEQLILKELPNLKGWRDTPSHSCAFPKLSHLDIDRCDNLNCATFPYCPALKVLPYGKHKLCLEKLIKEAEVKVSPRLLHLVIEGTDGKQILTTVEDRSHTSPLGSFKHITCRKTLSGLEKREDLTALETLEIISHYDLELNNADIPWRCFAPTLRSLTLDKCNIAKLPMGLSLLTSLRFLQISDCPRIETLPAWISCFSSLQSLTIKSCRNLCSLPKEMCFLTSLCRLALEDNSRLLYERCKKPDGIDWPNIQHIFHIRLNNQVFQKSLI